MSTVAERYNHIPLERDEDSSLPSIQVCSFCKQMNIEVLCSSEGFQHANSPEALWRVLSCRICRGLWPTATHLMQALEQSDRQGNGITLKLENSKGGTISRAYLDGELLHAEVSDRPQLTYVTVVEKEVSNEFGVTCENERNYTGSQFHIDRAKRWIQECQDMHEDCKARFDPPDEDQRWPGRLIFVGSASTHSRLISVSPSTTRDAIKYATLSHSWGTSGLPDHAKTTTENLAEMEAYIDIESLPRNFQDAIEATRRLGLEMLWIDALCIVQGSVEDWSREGRKMDAIYSNSTVTLAAESSLDAEGGLFSDTTRYEESLDEPISIKSTLSNGRGSTLMFRRSDSRSLKTKVAHLQSRAWCQQERVLANRTLHFFDAGILWECRRQYEIWHEPTANVPWYCISHIGAQFGKELLAPRHEYIGYQKELLLMENYGYHTLAELGKVRQIIREREFELPRWVMYMPWYRYIVPEYTSRNLTFKSDRLPAISSIARALHRQTESTYLAGLWEEEIALGLAWHFSAAPKDPETHESALISMPAIIPRPSWSWASYDRPCEWHGFNKRSDYWNEDISKTTFTSHMKLISHSVELASPDSFGQVLSGNLYIRGKPFHGDHFPGGRNVDGETIVYLKCRDGKNRVWRLGQQALQGEIVNGEAPSSVCLPLCSGNGSMYFLVLRKAEEPNVFERKSLFLFDLDRPCDQNGDFKDEVENWLENGEEKDIVLV